MSKLFLLLLILWPLPVKAQRDPVRGIPVLVYHRFDQRQTGATTVLTENFVEQIDWLAKHGYRIVPLQDVVSMVTENRLPPSVRQVAITVDDGHRSVYTELYPLIKVRHIPITLFIYPTVISKASYALTWEQLQEMKSSGLVRIESHTLWHPDFRAERKRLDGQAYAALVHDQLVKSRSILEQRLGIQVHLLAWPYGIFDDDLMQAAEQAGYTAAFAYDGKIAMPNDPRLAIHRIARSPWSRRLPGARADGCSQAGGEAMNAMRLVLLFAAFGIWTVRDCVAAVSQRVLITDANTGKAVSRVTVVIDGRTAPVDGSGSIEIAASAKSVSARAIGYWPYHSDIAALREQSTISLRPIAVHALYLTEYGIASKALREPVLDIIRRGGANALVITIKSDRGNLAYPSAIPLATQIGARRMTTIRSLPDLVTDLHSKGIYLIARIVTFKDDPLATAHPEYGVRLNSGGLFKDREHLSWTDPFRREVRDYNIAIAVEAAKAGFDEVQFDYVRFPDCPQKLQFSGTADEAGRVKAVTSFLAEAHKALEPFNAFLSVDIFGYVLWNRNDTGIGQRLEEIVPAVDYVCPMLYPSGFSFGIPGHPNPVGTNEDIYQTVRLSLEESIKRTHADPKMFRPWIQGFRDYAFSRRPFGAAEVASQTRAATDAHADGWSLWNARNVYTDACLK
ncbi:putative glycoside hydrolase [Terriglobus roseus]|uniref:NodB homology domain-containing protein n=1 Tax=Terriglobus roseus TaxID=392734 RepID=A0A1H4J7A4_9BACT|nr:putative glycoside hydrolase [Terriglobus roseus]SEB42097.1 hypothetical protein SAMN05443244_0414 [Terriglobus roseus]